MTKANSEFRLTRSTRYCEVVEKYNLRISDLHIHTGSEIKDVDVFVKGIEVLFDIAPSF